MEIQELKDFLAKPQEGMLYFDEELLWRFHLAVSSHPFVLLAGLPGSGKTSLALGYARYRTDDYEYKGYCSLHIRPEWNNSQALMGTYDSQRQEYLSTGFLDMVLRALRNPEKKYFVILDGIDLARPEHFLSDYFNAMGSEQSVRLHPIERCIPKAGVNREDANLVCHDLCVNCFFSCPTALPSRLPSMMSKFVPPMIYFPRNFVVIGTLLQEKWQDSLSTSTLDRAHLITLDGHSVASYLSGPAKGMVGPRTHSFICALEELLAAHNEGIGYRIVRQCMTFVEVGEKEGMNEIDLLDRYVEQRFLPRLRANLKDNEEAIKQLAELLASEGLPKSTKRFNTLVQTIQKP